MNSKAIALVGIFLVLTGCVDKQNSFKERFEYHHDISFDDFSKASLADVALISLSRYRIDDIEGFTPNDALGIFQTVGHQKIYFDMNTDSVTAISDTVSGAKYSATCRYIGNVNGKHIIFSEYFTGCCGITTDIYLCTKVKDGYYLKLIVGGNRANGGITNIPKLRGKRLYFSQHVDIRDFAKIAKVPEEILKRIPENLPQEYWNLSKCMYDFDTNKLSIIETTIYENAEAAKFLQEPTKKCLSFLKYTGKTIFILEDSIPLFLKEFSKTCEKFFKKEKSKPTSMY